MTVASPLDWMLHARGLETRLNMMVYAHIILFSSQPDLMSMTLVFPLRSLEELQLRPQKKKDVVGESTIGKTGTSSLDKVISPGFKIIGTKNVSIRNSTGKKTRIDFVEPETSIGGDYKPVSNVNSILPRRLFPAWHAVSFLALVLSFCATR